MAEMALENGITHAETAGSLHHWMSQKYLSHGTANNMRIYGDLFFVFDRNCLITFYQVSNMFKRTIAKIRAAKRATAQLSK